MRRDGKSKLERKVMEGIYGQPELKKEEKNRYLGQFKERVIFSLTYDDIKKEGVKKKFLTAINNSEAKKIVINRNVGNSYASYYIKLARDNNLKFKRVDSPDFKGDIALVVVSDHAVNV